jgi:hypothetical protein
LASAFASAKRDVQNVACSLRRWSPQRAKPRFLKVVAIKQIICIERDQSAIGMHNVNACFLYGPDVERVSIQELNDKHSKYVVVTKIIRNLNPRKTAQ